MQGGRSKNLSSFFIHNEYRARERAILVCYGYREDEKVMYFSLPFLIRKNL